MISNHFLDRAKDLCGRLIEKIFPEESTNFEDVWDAMLPIFKKWQRMKSGRRRFAVDSLLETTGLGFGDARDWGMPIGIAAVFATLLDMWDARGRCTEKAVRSALREYAYTFGGPTKLQELLEETASPFCLAFYQGMKWDEEYDREGVERRQQIEAAMPGGPLAVDYIVVTHKMPERSFTLEELAAFKKQHKPKDFFLWLDESQPVVFISKKRLKLGPRLRQVLRYLVEFRGQRVTHRQLVKACIGLTHGDEWNAKTSRRWIEKLREAGKGRLSKLIKTKDGGFMYDGPPSFCIIKSANTSRTT